MVTAGMTPAPVLLTASGSAPAELCQSWPLIRPPFQTGLVHMLLLFSLSLSFLRWGTKLQPETDWQAYLAPCRSNTVGDSMPCVESPYSHLNPQPVVLVGRHEPSRVGIHYNELISSGFKTGPPLETPTEPDCWQMPWRPVAPPRISRQFISGLRLTPSPASAWGSGRECPWISRAGRPPLCSLQAREPAGALLGSGRGVCSSGLGGKRPSPPWVLSGNFSPCARTSVQLLASS